MTIDQFFTDDALANQLTRALLDRIDPQRLRCYIEPSCGDGAFIRALQATGIPARSIRSVELDPKYEATVHGDFLNVTAQQLETTLWPPAITVTIGNPPFGRNGALARRFLNKAAEFSHWICLVMPRSMRDAHCCGNLNPRLTLIYEEELPVGSFMGTRAKCNWQEWFLLPEGSLGKRNSEPEVDNLGLYRLVDKNEPHDVVVQRCGGSAGRVTTCNGSGEGKYYIKTPYPAVLEAFHHLGSHPQAAQSTHQLTLSARLLHELFVEAGFRQWVQQIKGKK